MAKHLKKHALTDTEDHSGGNWKIVFTDGSGNVIELPLGSNLQVLTSQGPASAPIFVIPTITNLQANANKIFYSENIYGAITELSLGAANTFLQSQGASSAPVFGVPQMGNLQGNTWRVFYTDGSGNVIELPLGALNQVIISQGVASAPIFGNLAITTLVSGNDVLFFGNSSGVIIEVALGNPNEVLKSTSPTGNPVFGFINLTELDGNNWKVIHTNGIGNVLELALGADKTYLRSTGPTSAPVFSGPADIEGDVATTDATLTTLLTIPIPDNTAVSVRFRIVAFRTNGANQSTYEGVALFSRRSAAAAIEDGFTETVGIGTIGGAAGSSAAVSGNNGLIQVKGRGSRDINWHGEAVLVQET